MIFISPTFFFFYSFEKTYIVSRFNEYQNSKKKIFSNIEKKQGEGGGGGDQNQKNIKKNFSENDWFHELILSMCF